jgi:hypothetical protein
VIEQELLDAGKALVTKGDFKTAKEGQEWARRRMEQVHKAVGAVEGTLGSDIGSAWRNTTAWITVYQNLRLLPLTLFASVVDPLGMVARGGTMKQAYDTFLRGMKEVFANWGDMLRKEPKERRPTSGRSSRWPWARWTRPCSRTTSPTSIRRCT